MTAEKVRSELPIPSAYKWGFHDDDKPSFRSEKGLNEAVVRQISAMKDEPQWMLDFRLRAYSIFLRKPNPLWADGQLDGINFDEIYYYVRAADRQGDTWDDVPEYIKDTFDKLGIPEAERKHLAGVGAQYDSEVVYHNIREDLEKLGVIFCDMDTALREHPDIVQEVLRHDHPRRRQQVRGAQQRGLVRRQLRLRAEGREGRHPAAGLLPDQHREHGPVRADADHRRGGQLRALRRRLHRADLQHRLAPQRRRRDHRQEGRTRPLHDDPELVEQRLQPRDEARRGLSERRDGVGRRQPRLEADDEVPQRLPHGAGRARRDPLARVRGQGPAPGRRRQDRPRRARTHRRSLPRSRSARTAAAPAIAASSRSTRAPRT